MRKPWGICRLRLNPSSGHILNCTLVLLDPSIKGWVRILAIFHKQNNMNKLVATLAKGICYGE